MNARTGIGLGVLLLGAALLMRVRMPWPVVGRVSSPYLDPLRNKPHRGVDIAVPVGTPVEAPAGGVVVRAWPDNVYGGGLSLRVILENGLEAGFAHLSRWNLLDGASFRAGDVLAFTGETGNASGPHLHYTIRRDGKYIDPAIVSV